MMQSRVIDASEPSATFSDITSKSRINDCYFGDSFFLLSKKKDKLRTSRGKRTRHCDDCMSKVNINTSLSSLVNSK